MKKLLDIIHEGGVSDLHHSISSAMDKHIDSYKAGDLGHDQFGERIVRAHMAIAKKHSLTPETAKRFVNSYVSGQVKESIEAGSGNEEVEPIDEISKELAHSYLKQRYKQTGATRQDKPKGMPRATHDKQLMGLHRATRRLTTTLTIPKGVDFSGGGKYTADSVQHDDQNTIVEVKLSAAARLQRALQKAKEDRERQQRLAQPFVDRVFGKKDQKQGVAEAGMPSSVIKNKQRYAGMTDQEFHQAHKDKSEDDLRAMAWRHGYGKGSSHYVDKLKKGQPGVAEERTETKNEKGEVTSWRDESEWRKVGQNKQGRGRVTNLSDKARRETEKLAKEKGMAEGESNAIANTASRLANKDDGKVAKLRAAGDKRREDQLKGRDIAKRDRTSKDSWQIDELNKETLGSYVAKATDSAADNAISLGYKAGRREGGSEYVSKLAKRVAGIKKAAGKMVKEEEVIEYNERSGYSSSKMGGERTTNSTPSVKMGGERTTYTRTPVKDVAKKAFNALTGGSDKDHLDRLRKNMYKEEVEEVGEATSHQAATTMKHIPNASPALKKAAKDIKPGIAGYRDRIDMLKVGGVKEEVEQIDEYGEPSRYDSIKKFVGSPPRPRYDSIKKFVGSPPRPAPSPKVELDLRVPKPKTEGLQPQDKKMKSLTEILEATAPKLHPDALHVTPVKVGGQTKYHVKAVGKNISHGIKVGEHLTDTHLDDATEMGAKIKHIKENIEVEVFEPEADMNILIQLRKSVDILEHGTQGGANVVFGNGETMFVEGAVAKKLVESLESIKPNDRATVASFLYQSHDNMMAVYGRLK